MLFSDKILGVPLSLSFGGIWLFNGVFVYETPRINRTFYPDLFVCAHPSLFELPHFASTVVCSGGSRPSAKEGAHVTMNVEFYEDNSGTSKKMRYFLKNKVGARAPPLDISDPPLVCHAVLERWRCQ